MNSTGTIAGFSLSNGSVSGSTEMLPGGTYSVTAHYPGDSTYGASDSGPLTVTVNKENSQPQAFLVTTDGNGNILNSHTSTAEYGSTYWLRVNVENASGQMCAPTASSGATACPSGNVSVTNNGGQLDVGTFGLNSFGYFEDRAVQLPGGTDSVTAAYTGDGSFNASTVTTPVTITPAPTQMVVSGAFGAVVGQPTTISALVAPYAVLGAAPTGTVSFFVNGAAISGTVNYSTSGSGPQDLNASLSYTFTESGTYTITATYSGDSNYTSSSNASPSITVKYPTPTVNVTPYSQTINYGATASITVLVDTTNKSVYPTGTVTLVNNGTVAGPFTCANAKDASGNFACQVTATFTVTAGGSIQVNYSGDSNFPASYSWAYISMPDFTFSASGWVQLSAGQSQTLTVTFTSVNGLSGTVGNFDCSSLPAETTCSFSPTQITLPGNGTASTMLTVTTTALGESRKNLGFGDRRARNWGISGFILVLGVCFFGIPRSRPRGRVAAALIVAALFFLLPSCGGGGGGGGSENPIPTITSLSPTKVAAGSQVQSLYINGTNFLNSSTVTFNGVLQDSSLQSPTQLQIALGPSDDSTTGSYPVIVSNPGPGGGSSAPMSFNIVTGTPTGYFTANANATIGSITHSTQLSMNIQ